VTVLDDDRELSDAIDEPPREPWYGTVMPVIALTAVALVAVAVAVSADLVVSREPVGQTGAVVPTIPITITPHRRPRPWRRRSHRPRPKPRHERLHIHRR